MRYPDNRADLAEAKKIYKPAIYNDMSELGIVALYQRCVHLGCRVPFCQTSQWFECPCHGSKYSRVGEKKAGPAPRGLDRFYATVEATAVTIDTGNIFLGPPIGTNTTGQNAEGPAVRVTTSRPASEAPFVIAAIWKNDLRHWLIWLNFVVFAR